MQRESSSMMLALLLALGGCAAYPARIATVERRQAELGTETAALQKKVADLDARLAALAKRLGALQASKTPQRDLDQRPSQIEGRLGVGEQEQPQEPRRERPRETPDGRLPVVVQSPVPAPELDVDGLNRESSRQLPGGYQRGLELLRQGAYDQAIQSLRDFMRARHTSPFVPGAQYWIGQAHMQLDQFYQAILAFTDVQQRFPRDDYAPPAAYAAGLAFLQLGNASEARRAFERVIADHPGTPQATKAEGRLRELEGKTR
jgi:tol-pal system protein YbgF